MNRLRFDKIYIEFIFPIYLFLNMLTMTTFCYIPEGEKASVVVLAVKGCRYAIYLISLIKFATSRFKNKVLLWSFLVFGTFFISLVFTRDTEYFCYIIVFIALIGEQGRKIIKKHYHITLALVLLMVFLSQIGIVEDYVSNDTRARHFLGFNWTTYPSILMVFLLLDKIYLNGGKLHFYEAIFFVLMGVWLFRKTDSRFAFAMLLAISVFFLVFNTRAKRIKHLNAYRWLLCIPWLCGIVSFVIGKIYTESNSFLFKINSLLSQRLRLAHEALIEYPIKIIGGQQIKWQGFSRDFTTFVGYNYVDNSYIQIMLQYGLFLFVMVLLFYTMGIHKGIKEGRPYLCWILMVICLFGMIEPYMLRFTFNPFVWLGVEIIRPHIQNKSLFLQRILNKKL